MSFDQEALAELRKDTGSAQGRYQTRTGQRRRRWVVAVAVLVAAAIGWMLLGRSGPLEVRTTVAAPPPAPGSTAVLSASGYIVARRLATVSAKVTGRIVSVEFEEGSTAESGQVLARLERPGRSRCASATPRARSCARWRSGSARRCVSAIASGHCRPRIW